MYLEKQQSMPDLLTIQKKPNQSTRNKSKIEEMWSKPEQTKNNSTEAQPQANRDNPARNDVANKPIVVDNDKQRAYKKATQISKNLINEMMNKITVKTLAEDNYSISNETVQKLLISLEEQIKALKIELGKFQNSLLLNPTKQHLKKEKESVQKKLNQIQTIKDLYNQKFQNRNKISQLEAKIIELKNENKELKIKIARDIEKIQSHIHNLPCQREKELIEEVNKYKHALEREKEMRQNLELNIQNINLNFKRFYLQADQARKIVNQQLKEISKKDQEIKNIEEKLKYQKSDNKSTKVENIQATSDVYGRKVTNKMSEEEKIAEIIKKINLNELDNLNRNRSNSIKAPGSIVIGRPKNNQGSDGLGGTCMPFNQTRSKFNLQDQIEKMRRNQTQFVKLTKRK